MPLYEYECKSCGQVLEFLMKISDPSPDKCTACHNGPLEKILSKTHFVLKGTGWYETDFKDKSKAAVTSAAKDKADVPKAEKDSSSNGSKSEDKSESKSEKVQAAPASSESNQTKET